MHNDEIIEVEVDPKERRQTLWRMLFRYLLPFGSIALIALGLVGSSILVESLNREDIRTLSNDYVRSISAQIRTQVGSYLMPASNAVRSLAGALPETPNTPEARATFERLARRLLQEHPQIALAYVAAPNGEFLMVRRNSQGTADTKVIEQRPEGPISLWHRRDADGAVVATEVDGDDRYDPRTRGWYRAASDSPDPVWSELYVFFTDKVPGITVSQALRNEAGTLTAIVGVDIYLSSLSDLLQTLQEQARGTLTIIDEKGYVVAFHQPELLTVENESGLRLRSIRELAQPELSEAFDRFRVEGIHRNIINIDGQRYLFSTEPLTSAVSQDWWLLLLAPESAYIDFVAANGKRGLIATSGIIVLAIVLAGFLTYQGVISERNVRALHVSRQGLEEQRAIFDELAGYTDLCDPADVSDLQDAAKTMVRAEGARRVSIWRIGATGEFLICLEAYDHESHDHSSGLVLPREDCQELLPEVIDGVTVDVADVADNPLTASLNRSYFEAVGTRSFASIPIEQGDRVLGAVWIEDADDSLAVTGDRSVARAVCNLLGPRLQRLAAADAESQPAAGTPAGSTSTAGGDLADRVDAVRGGGLHGTSIVELRRQNSEARADDENIVSAVHRDVTVLSLRLLDDRVLAQGQMGVSSSPLMKDIVDAIEDRAEAAGVPYVKVLTDQIVAIDGFDGDPRGGADRLVDVALELREHCLSLFQSHGLGPQFAMGMDSGVVFGTALGSGGQTYNVWGEPVRVADALAGTAEPGTIQASEDVFVLLRESCIFRRRGAFYIANVGEMDTYAVRGRT